MAGENGSACYGRGGNDFLRPILIFVAAKENGFACGDRCGDAVLRPILIFVAAKKNGPPAAVVWHRSLLPILIFVAAKENGSACCCRCCSDSGFEWVNLGIAARITRVLALGLQRFLIPGAIWESLPGWVSMDGRGRAKENIWIERFW